MALYKTIVNCFTRKLVYDKMLEEKVQRTLVELREKAQVTQKQLADALGVTDHTVRNWEKDEPKLNCSCGK